MLFNIKKYVKESGPGVICARIFYMLIQLVMLHKYTYVKLCNLLKIRL